MLDETAPLTRPEWPEWGDPNHDAAAFRTILVYSPYENVRGKSYPNTARGGTRPLKER
jgi:oligopeptidase B